jgi:hypothetical protein
MSDARDLAAKQAWLETTKADVLAALTRARRRAEEIAARTNTALIQAVDGKPVRVDPPRLPELEPEEIF